MSKYAVIYEQADEGTAFISFENDEFLTDNYQEAEEIMAALMDLQPDGKFVEVKNTLKAFREMKDGKPFTTLAIIAEPVYWATFQAARNLKFSGVEYLKVDDDDSQD